MGGTRRYEGVVAALSLQADGEAPLFRQIYSQLRNAILLGQLFAGSRLPSSRTLARHLGVARNTVLDAYDQLKAEGYLEGHVGSGTVVARDLPDDCRPLPVPAASFDNVDGPRDGSACFTPFAEAACAGPQDLNPLAGRAFEIDLPAEDAFPYATWCRLTAHVFRRRPREVLSIGDPAGYEPLRHAIASHLGPTRGIACTANEVLITSGSQHAVDLLVRSLLRPGEAVLIEDPGERGVRANLVAAGMTPVPIPVDGEGLRVDVLKAKGTGARMVYVTPSNQYPLGGTMSMPRRLALVRWANYTGGWIIEDDCDSEFRHVDLPLVSLKGLDDRGSVIYVGTFSRSLLRSLRVGYVVAARPLIDALVQVRSIVDRHPPPIEQALIAEFMERGHFAAHIRRMRRLYHDRQRYLIDVAKMHSENLIELRSNGTGMHLVGWLPPHLNDVEVAACAARYGLVVRPLSHFYHDGIGPRPALLVGYSGVTTGQVRTGISVLASVLREQSLSKPH